MRKGSREHSRSTSRKWKLVLLIVMLATLGTFLPPIFSMWFLGASAPLVILNGTEWVSVIALIVSAYFGANVYQKHVELRNGLVPYEFGTASEPDPEMDTSITRKQLITKVQDEDDTNKEA